MLYILANEVDDNKYRIQFDVVFKKDLDIQIIYEIEDIEGVESLDDARKYAKSQLISRLQEMIEEIRADSS